MQLESMYQEIILTTTATRTARVCGSRTTSRFIT